MKKTISTAFVVLFVFSGFTVSINSEQESFHSDGDTLYVGGSGSGNYSTIQAAIENASDGDTVFVYSGIYHLTDTINFVKKINLLGEHKNTTILTSEQNQNQLLNINAEEISIRQFTLQNIIITNLHEDHVTICNNTFKINVYNQNWGNGVINSEGLHHTFKDNTIILYNQTGYKKPYHGINLGVSHSIISNNTITGAKTGLYINGYDNTILGNTFIENEIGLWFNFPASAPAVNQITDNNFIDNQNHADFFITLNDPFFSLLSNLISYHGIPSQNWNHNYWENHNSNIPKKIKGHLNIDPLEILGIDTRVQYTFQIPWTETDPNPASTPQ